MKSADCDSRSSIAETECCEETGRTVGGNAAAEREIDVLVA